MFFEALLDVIVQEVEVGYNDGEDEEMAEVMKNFGLHVMKKAYREGRMGKKQREMKEVIDEIDCQPEDMETEE